jgi:hypothetical protein
MVYIISSTTPWPAAKEKSINLLYEFKNDSGSNIFFGGYGIIESTVIFKEQERVIFDEDLEKLQNPLKIGQSIKGPLFSSFIISNNADSNRYMDYTKRALNFYELFEGTNKDNIWLNLEKLIQLALNQKKSDIDSFFIRLSFFPTVLFTNLEDFFNSLFLILNRFPSDTFVIIVDENIPYIFNFLKNFSKKISIDDSLNINKKQNNSSEKEYEINSDFVFRICSSMNGIQTFQNQKLQESLFTKNNFRYMFLEIFNNNTLTKDFKEYKERTKFYFDIDNEDALINRFHTFINKCKQKDQNFYVYKHRLLRQIKDSNNFTIKFVPYRLIKKVLETYFDYTMFNPIVRDFLYIFQRVPVSNDKYKEHFHVTELNNNDITTWTRLATRIYKIFPESDNYTCSSYRDIIKFKTEFYCGVKKKKEPENNEGLKEFIFQACICASFDCKQTESILNKYGFAFVDFSLKDYLYKYLINFYSNLQKQHIQTEKQREKEVASLYKELLKIIDSN